MTIDALHGAVDLGGSHVGLALGVVDTAAGEFRLVARRDLEGGGYDGWQTVLDRIAEGLLELTREVGEPPAAIGVGCPGWVDLEQGETRFLPNLPGQWRDVPVARLLGERLGAPVRLLNDVRAATLGEFTFGAGRGTSTMALFALGTGIGGGVVVDGRLRLGPLGSAGELGHQIVDPAAPSAAAATEAAWRRWRAVRRSRPPASGCCARARRRRSSTSPEATPGR